MKVNMSYVSYKVRTQRFLWQGPWPLCGVRLGPFEKLPLSILWGPEINVMYHLKGPSPTNIRMGRPRNLTDEEETALVGLLAYMAQQGVPASRDVLNAKVRELVNSSG